MAGFSHLLGLVLSLYGGEFSRSAALLISFQWFLRSTPGEWQISTLTNGNGLRAIFPYSSLSYLPPLHTRTLSLITLPHISGHGVRVLESFSGEIRLELLQVLKLQFKYLYFILVK